MRRVIVLSALAITIGIGVASLRSQPATPPAATQPAGRTTVTVTSTADTGPGSLRSALRNAESNTTIRLGSGPIVNKSVLVLSRPGVFLAGEPGTRTRISGRQFSITASRTSVRDLEFFGDPDENGRSLLIISYPGLVSDVDIDNVVVHAGGDDGAGCWGKFRNVTFRNCTFLSDTYAPCQKALILGAEKGTPQPDVRADQGYAATFINCKIAGCYGNPRCSGGVYVFKDCEIDVTALGGAILMEARVNFIRCRFRTFPKPPDAPYWYRPEVGPAPIVLSGLDARGERNSNPPANSIYIEDCTINGTPATAAELCSLSSPKGYAGVGTVPANVFRTKPW